MEYDLNQKFIVCSICKMYGKPPVQARGAWMTRPVNNCVMAESLLSQHEQSDWHLAAV